MTMHEFFDMGGYGFYVWSCYAATAVVFIALFVMVKSQRSRLVKQLQRQYRQEKRATKEPELKASHNAAQV
ncbi:MAG: heme exporter protein CcmD [Kangiellaceae bacterium]|nr:heme exporter protein CcmD [Kangiellaceae bacterium]MCW8999255.1 heme exporter protein CcmD [Kangiellaceae bacterium]